MRAIFALLVVAVALSFAGQASAFCIPYWAGTFDECDPGNGEPPSWCNEPGVVGFAQGLVRTENKVGAVIALAKAAVKAPTYK